MYFYWDNKRCESGRELFHHCFITNSCACAHSQKHTLTEAHTRRSTHSHPENICSVFITMRGACSLLRIRGGDLTDKQHTKWNAHSHTFTQSSSTWAAANGTSSQTRAPRRAAWRETSFLSSCKSRHANQCKTVKQLQKGTVVWKTPAWKSLVFLTRARSQRDGSRQSCAAASHSLLKIAAVRIDE